MSVPWLRIVMSRLSHHLLFYCDQQICSLLPVKPLYRSTC